MRIATSMMIAALLFLTPGCSGETPTHSDPLAVVPGITRPHTRTDHERVADLVAQSWTQHEEVGGAVVELAGELIAEKIPGVPDLTAQLTAQIGEDIEWSVSLPEKLGSDLWRVTLTATSELEIDPPALKPIPFTLTVPVDLDIKTTTQEVTAWTVNADLATVERGE